MLWSFIFVSIPVFRSFLFVSIPAYRCLLLDSFWIVAWDERCGGKGGGRGTERRAHTGNLCVLCALFLFHRFFKISTRLLVSSHYAPCAIRARTHTHTYTHTHIHTRTRTRTHTCAHTCTRARMQTNTYTHTCMHERTDTHAHIHTFTHKHRHAHTYNKPNYILNSTL